MMFFKKILLFLLLLLANFNINAIILPGFDVQYYTDTANDPGITNYVGGPTQHFIDYGSDEKRPIKINGPGWSVQGNFAGLTTYADTGGLYPPAPLDKITLTRSNLLSCNLTTDDPQCKGQWLQSLFDHYQKYGHGERRLIINTLDCTFL